MIKIIKSQPVPKEQIECNNCGSILEYENVDLELHQGYMTAINTDSGVLYAEFI